MAKNPIELQHQIRQTALHTHNEINNLKTWEKEMATKEAEYLNSNGTEDNTKKVRNHNFPSNIERSLSKHFLCFHRNFHQSEVMSKSSRSFVQRKKH